MTGMDAAAIARTTRSSCPQVFERTAAATDDQSIDVGPRARKLDRRAQRCRRIDALHEAWVDHDAHMRRAARERRQHIVQRCPGQRGDDSYLAGERGDRPLAAGIEEALSPEHRLEPHKALEQRAVTCAQHCLDDELQLAAGLVDADPPAHLDQLAIAGREIDKARGTPEHGAAQDGGLAIGIFQAEITMPARSPGERADLAPHGDRAKAPGKRVTDFAHQFGNPAGRAQRPARERLNHVRAQCWRGPRTPQPRRTRVGMAGCLSRSRHLRIKR